MMTALATSLVAEEELLTGLVVYEAVDGVGGIGGAVEGFDGIDGSIGGVWI